MAIKVGPRAAKRMWMPKCAYRVSLVVLLIDNLRNTLLHGQPTFLTTWPSLSFHGVKGSLQDVGRTTRQYSRKADGALQRVSQAAVQLTGVAEEVILKKALGSGGMHSKSVLHLAFNVEDCLNMLSGFDSGLHEDVCTQRKKAYGMHRQVLEATGRSVALGGTATRIWSGGPMKFWSVSVCRTQDSSLEKIDDHKFVADLMQKRPLASSEDLALYGDNWTFILNKVHAASLDMQSLHHALWASFGVSGDFNVYLTPPISQGLAPHADNHDVFVVQQAGQKTWTLLEQGKATVVENVTLLPGDVLYLPQGVPHYARSAGEGSSLHVTMSVYRGHFTFAGLLAAWLELDSSDPDALFDQSWASQIDAAQARLTSQGVDQANQPLPPSLSLPLLRALDADDLPKDIVAAAVKTAEELSKQLVDRMRQEANKDDLKVASRLERVLERSDGEKAQSFLEATFALRQLRWIKHYRLYGPKILRSPSESEPLPLPGDVRLRRAADAAAMRTNRGDLLLNGYLITGLPPEAQTAVQFCLSRYIGASGKTFKMDDIPGPREVAASVVQLLLEFDGVECFELKGEGL